MSAAIALTTTRHRVISDTALLWASVGFMAMRFVGAHVDAWYHLHYGFAIESFFTWPHALLYAGWVAGGLVLALYLLDSIRLGVRPRAWLPAGFLLVGLGIVLFGLGGAFDIVWHNLVGFEVRLETLLAPSHQWLVVSTLITSFGLLQASARERSSVPSYRPALSDVPLVLSLCFILRGTLWSLFYSEPSAIDYASGASSARLLFGFAGPSGGMALEIAGVTGILLHTVLVALFLAAPLWHLRLPGGSIAALLLFDGLLVAASTDLWRYLPAVIGAALLGEVIWARMWRGGLRGIEGETGYWLIGAAVPALQFFLYFALMEGFGGGVLWSTHLWAGTPLLAGLFGLIATMLVVPPLFLRLPRS